MVHISQKGFDDDHQIFLSNNLRFCAPRVLLHFEHFQFGKMKGHLIVPTGREGQSHFDILESLKWREGQHSLALLHRMFLS